MLRSCDKILSNSGTRPHDGMTMFLHFKKRSVEQWNAGARVLAAVLKELQGEHDERSHPSSLGSLCKPRAQRHLHQVSGLLGALVLVAVY